MPTFIRSARRPYIMPFHQTFARNGLVRGTERQCSAGSRSPVRWSATLFLVGAIVTTAILLWTDQLRQSGDMHGLATIFFVLFADNDSPGCGVCAAHTRGRTLRISIPSCAAVRPLGR